MHVLFTTSATGGPSGGSEFLWMRAAELLLKQGEQVTAAVAWSRKNNAALHPRRKAGAEVLLLPDGESRPTIAARLARRLMLAPRKNEFDWLDRIDTPDFTVSSLTYHLYATGLADECRHRGWAYGNLVQAASWQAWPNDDQAESLRAAFEKAAANWFVAADNWKTVEWQIAADVPHAEIIFNPFQVPFHDPPPWPPMEKGLKLACPSRLELAAKAHDVLIEVLAQPKWRGRAVTLSFFGQGSNAETILQLIARNKLENKVFLRGFAQSIRDVWAGHHGLLLASRSEGLPLAVVEAMLCARVPIVTEVGGSAELIDDNRTGFVAAQPTVSLVEEALERAWQHREEWKTIGEAAATAARARIPADPVAHFCERIRHAAETRRGG